MRIIVADDHPLITIVVKKLLSRRGLDVFEVNGGGDEILKIIHEHSFDILIVDYAMPCSKEVDGFRFLGSLTDKFPKLPIIVYTALDNRHIIKNIKMLGISRIVSKRDALSCLNEALKSVQRDRAYFSPEIDILLRSAECDERSESELSINEWEVIRLYGHGLTVSEIAKRFKRSKKTVSAQKISAMKKLGVDDDFSLQNLTRRSRLFF